MKKIILLLFTYSLSLISFCFSQEIEWQNTIGGSSTDIFYCIRPTSDGGYILSGTSGSDISGDKTENTMGATDYWIVKTDHSGNIQWQNTIGGNDIDEFRTLQETTDGGFIIGGYSQSDSTGDKTENPIGYYDWWILKLDAAGNILWQNTIGGDFQDYLFCIQQTSDGGFILGGTSESDSSGDKTENSNGVADYWVVKIDSLGNIQWQNTIGGNTYDNFNSIQQTNDGGYIVGGKSISDISGDKTENCIGNWDYWIVKIDSLGNVQWDNTIGSSGDDELSSVQQTPDAGYILAGWSSAGISGDKTVNTHGGADYWVIKTDSSGNIQWQKSIGGSNNDLYPVLQQTWDGGFIIGGWSKTEFSGDKTENCFGQEDYWIIKTDGLGNIQWQNTIGGIDIDKFNFIYPSATNGDYILGGTSISNTSGEKTENCIGNEDYWIVKLTENYNLITGKLFIDANSNNLQDAGEPSLENKTVTETNTGRLANTSIDGKYSVSVLDSGNFAVSPSAINYYNALPATHNVYFAATQQIEIDSLNDFAFQPAGVFNDLCVTITPIGPFRANMNANYIINYENVGTTTLNGTIIFFPDNAISFVSSSISPLLVTADSIKWNTGTLSPFQSGNILVTVHVNTGTPIGTYISSSVRIDPVAGDANTVCNYSTWRIQVTGSFDPNAILVDRDTVLTTELSSPPLLNYIIYFQNTGNDTAFNVKVLNPIDTFKLDIHSFEFVASSHSVNINYKIWERNFEFKFDNILLPDSNINEPESHGFIRYRIKPKTTLVAGDEIQNTAYIYFDFNQPVITNTAVTEIVLPTGIGGQTAEVRGQMVIFPNPVRDELIVNSNSLTGKKAEIKIYDLYGREVLKMEVGSQKSEARIDVSGFSQGVYIIEMREGEKVLRGKFLKE